MRRPRLVARAQPAVATSRTARRLAELEIRRWVSRRPDDGLAQPMHDTIHGCIRAYADEGNYRAANRDCLQPGAHQIALEE